ncbi:MAG: hypothetical protein ACOY99_04135 [Pseudomonadota bacterium]
MAKTEELPAIIARAIERPVAAAVGEVARRLARRLGGVNAVLFYGSCLRTGLIAGQMLDFYLIVDDYHEAYRRRLLALANRLLPPNVFYFEADIDGVRVRAKYAVLSSAQLLRLCSARTFSPALWARFAQPIALVYARDEAARAGVIAALSTAPTTLLATTTRLALRRLSPRDLWRHAFALTYATEFRAERADRPAALYDLEADFYNAITLPALGQAGISVRQRADGALDLGPGGGTVRARLAWLARRLQGRTLHILRLMKAAATFDGGIDYLAWKIERHSGVVLAIKPWHRRHPVVAGLLWLPRLKGRGAIR